MAGAGKSTCVDYMTSKNIPHVYFGGIIVEETKKRYGKITQELEKIVREDLRVKEGKSVLAQRIISQIEQLVAEGHKQIVVDGLYSWTEYKLFKARFGETAIVVAVAAPRRLRHERLATRPVRPLTDKEATAREYAEIEDIEKGGPIANADYTIVNNTTKEDLLVQLDTVLTTSQFISQD